MRKSILFLALLLAVGAQAAEKKVYTSYNSSTKTLTYYYDALYGSRSNVEDYKPTNTFATRWAEYHDQVEKVVISASMQIAPLTTMEGLFCGSVNQSKAYLSNVTVIEDIKFLNMEDVKSTTGMFQGCKSLTSLDLSTFNTAKVTNMSSMFNGCEALEELDLSQFNTSIVTNMAYMFQNCKTLTSLDLSTFNTANVTNMSYMFYGCSKLTTIYCAEDWNQNAKLSSSTNVFYACVELVGGKGTTYDTSKLGITYARPDEGKNSDHPGYFTAPCLCAAPTGLKVESSTYHSAVISWTPGSDQQTSYIVRYGEKGQNMVEELRYTTSIELFSLKESTEYEVQVQGYCECSESEWAYSDYSEVFSFKTPQNPNPKIYTVFKDGVLTYYCNREMGTHTDAIEEEYDPYSPRFVDYNDQVVKAVIDKSMQDTVLLTANSFFYGFTSSSADRNLKNLTEIEGMENLNTSELKNTYRMFYKCESLKSLDLSSFNMKKVWDARDMFSNCKALEVIYCNDDWSQYTTLEKSSSMFAVCSALTGGNGTTYDFHKTNKEYARPDEGPDSDAPGYFTSKTPTALDQITNDQMRKCENAKILRDGQLFILRGDKVYSITGQEVK